MCTITNPPPPRPARSRLRLQVEEADVSGSLEGSLESSGKVSIRSTGLVSGNVIYKKMVRPVRYIVVFVLGLAALNFEELVAFVAPGLWLWCIFLWFV